MKRWSRLLLSAGAVTLVAASCQCGGIEVEDAGFQCVDDSDCIDGFKCIAARCRVEPTGDDGGTDAGHDGGTDGGSKDGGTDGGVDGGACVLDAGAPNCALSVCLGHACGSSGVVCRADGGCACGGNGGTPQATETSCGDGHDNDCDGKTDCADSDCHCETNCSDGVDNDSNGQTDCADSNCLHQSCTTDGGHVCCGTSCVDLTTSESNCGGCGLSCANNRTCTKSGLSGVCTCASTANCPGSQVCQSNLCDCDSASDCASGESCNGTACEY